MIRVLDEPRTLAATLELADDFSRGVSAQVEVNTLPQTVLNDQ
jgi:hypothetical protein